MHEATIVMSILGIARRAMADRPDALVSRIEISVGKLRAVEPCLLETCFAELSDGSACQGAALAINTIPITARCRDCGRITRINRFRFRCHTCSSADLDIVTGRELRVDRLIARSTQAEPVTAMTDPGRPFERKQQP